MKPLVSIIIPCFNGERFVGDAIRSALAQTYEPKEIIVIDDGSVDRSLEVIRSFGSAIRRETQPNRGGGAARNRGLELARGEYVQFLDADDLLDPHKIERQVEASGRLKRSISICWGQTDPPDPYLDRAYTRQLRDGDAIGFVSAGILPTTAPLHRSELLREVGGFDVHLPCAQERDLHLRLTCSGIGLLQHPQVLFTVRRREGSVSADPVKVLRQHPTIVGRAAAILETRGELNQTNRCHLAAMLARAARGLLKAGDEAAGMSAFRSALDLDSGAALESWSPWAKPIVDWLGPARAVRLATALGR